MKRILASTFAFLLSLCSMAQGWPEHDHSVMLQGFYWDSFQETQWTNLEKMADDFADYFNLVWVPQSGKGGSIPSMGYNPLYYFNQHSSFGTRDELKNMIKTFKQRGIGTIADVVINHHETVGWFIFPPETYNGVTYQFQSTDICADDGVKNGNSCQGAAEKQKVQLSKNNDEGDDWGGMRDLDHKSENVQKIVKAYERMLIDDLGYVGFRYDMAKGFAGYHFKDYNSAANAKYSVGEVWTYDIPEMKKWIENTEWYSGVFDFPFKRTVEKAIHDNNWTKLGEPNTVVSDTHYRRYIVTYVENHDTQIRKGEHGENINLNNGYMEKDTLAANAYMLAMPGTPCVFLPHYLKYPQEIKKMIDVRKFAGIHNESFYETYAKDKAYYAITTKGDDGEILVVVGPKANSLPVDTHKYKKILSGYHYVYYADVASFGSKAWISLPGGKYQGRDLKVRLDAVSVDNYVQLAYTTDGTTPDLSSRKVAPGTEITLPEGRTVLRVTPVVNGKLGKSVTRVYKVEDFKPHTIRVYVNADRVGWNDYVNFHSWGGTQTGTQWPGEKVTRTETINGKKWFYKDYELKTADDYVNFVFSTGTDGGTASKNQTFDKNNVKETSFFDVSPEKDYVGVYFDSGKDKGPKEEHYFIDNLTPVYKQKTIRIYVNTEQVGWNDYVNIHSWGGSHADTQWPGDKVTDTEIINGKKWFYKDYTLNNDDDYVNFVFSRGTVADAYQSQTVDREYINKTSFFTISSVKEGDKFNIQRAASKPTPTGISMVHEDLGKISADNAYYTLSGQRLNGKPSQCGIYIHNGKKIVVK